MEGRKILERKREHLRPWQKKKFYRERESCMYIMCVGGGGFRKVWVPACNLMSLDY